MIVRAALGALLLIAGCGLPDPCATRDGTCLEVDVEGAMSLDTLRFDLSGAASHRFTREAHELPAALAVLLPSGSAGPILVRVEARLADRTVALGFAQGELVPGGRVRLGIDLGAVEAASCTDGYLDGSETDVDCGGGCPACVSAAGSTVAVDPTQVIANGADRTTVTVKVVDATGRPLAGLAVALQASGGGNLLEQPAVSDAAGVAVGSLASTVAEHKTITATADGVPLAQAANVDFVAGAATLLGFEVGPGTSAAGVPLAPAVVVAVKDAAGNLVGTPADVTLAIGSNPGSATLGGTRTVAISMGRATFNDLTLDRPGTGYTLVATAAGLPSITSDPFQVQVGPAGHLAFLAQPGGGATGAPLAPTIQVALEDALGNVIPSSASVTITLANNPGGGTLSGSAVVAATAGVASFSNLLVDRAGLGYSLQASAAGYTAATSAPFDLEAWLPARSGLAPGRVNRVAVDPGQPMRIYAGTQGGVYKSNDGGTSWAFAGLVDHAVHALAVSASAVYAGADGAVYRSTDGGTTWQPISTGLPGKRVWDLRVLPGIPDTLYAGINCDGGVAGCGFYQSTNGGASWSTTASALFDALTVVVDPLTPTTLYEGGDGTGIHVSTDGGSTWTAANTGLTSFQVFGLAIDPAAPATLYAGTAGGVFKSTDGAQNWTSIQGEPLTSLAVDPASGAVYAAGGGDALYKTVNGGMSWTGPLYPGGQRTLFDLVFPPAGGALYVASVRGVFKTIDGGMSFTAAGNGFTNADVFSLAADPTAPSILYAGAGNGLAKSTNGGTTWTELFGTHDTVSVVAVDPVAPGNVFAGEFAGPLSKSTTQGASFSPLAPGYVHALAIDPLDHLTVYAGTDAGLVKSTDGGASWSPGVALGLGAWALAAAPTTPTTLYAGIYQDRIFQSTDGGASWTSASTGFTDLTAFALVLDPAVPGTLYAGSERSVFKSTNGGANWFDTGAALGGRGVFTLAIHPSAPNVVYAGTTDGVFRSGNGGVAWTRVTSGLPLRAITSLLIDPQTPALMYAGTLGGGIFKSLTGGQ